MWMKVNPEGQFLDYAVMTDAAAERYRKQGGYVREVVAKDEVVGPVEGISTIVDSLRQFVADNRCQGVSVYRFGGTYWQICVDSPEAVVLIREWLSANCPSPHVGRSLRTGTVTKEITIGPKGVTGVNVTVDVPEDVPETATTQRYNVAWFSYGLGKSASVRFLEHVRGVVHRLGR